MALAVIINRSLGLFSTKKAPTKTLKRNDTSSSLGLFGNKGGGPVRLTARSLKRNDTCSSLGLFRSGKSVKSEHFSSTGVGKSSARRDSNILPNNFSVKSEAASSHICANSGSRKVKSEATSDFFSTKRRNVTVGNTAASPRDILCATVNKQTAIKIDAGSSLVGYAGKFSDGTAPYFQPLASLPPAIVEGLSVRHYHSCTSAITRGARGFALKQWACDLCPFIVNTNLATLPCQQRNNHILTCHADEANHFASGKTALIATRPVTDADSPTWQCTLCNHGILEFPNSPPAKAAIKRHGRMAHPKANKKLFIFNIRKNKHVLSARLRRYARNHAYTAYQEAKRTHSGHQLNLLQTKVFPMVSPAKFRKGFISVWYWSGQCGMIGMPNVIGPSLVARPVCTPPIQKTLALMRTRRLTWKKWILAKSGGMSAKAKKVGYDADAALEVLDQLLDTINSQLPSEEERRLSMRLDKNAKELARYHARPKRIRIKKKPAAANRR